MGSCGFAARRRSVMTIRAALRLTLALGFVFLPNAAGALRVPELVKDIDRVILSFNPDGMTNVDGMILFAASDPVSGCELWRSDGPAAGTALVKDITPGTADSLPAYFVPRDVNGTLFFAASDPAHGTELWRSDGTEAGTVLVKDINPGPDGSDPDWLANLDGALYFTASEPNTGRQPLTKHG